MDEAWTLIVLSIAMLLGCYLAGSVPLSIPMSEDKLKLVTVLGAGLLVGTALAVIIPEGIHALLSAANTDHHHDHHIEAKSLKVAPKAALDSVAASLGSAGSLAAPVHDDHNHQGVAGEELHKWIGVTLVLGFVFMLLVDQIGGSLHSHSSSSSSSSSRTTPSESGGGGSRLRITATLGLVVHAAADGIALGAAASTSHSDVTMIVFVAIMLHKAPAAFGLSSFLMHEGFDRNRIRKHLAAFALAAPLLSIVTYFGLSQGGKETLSEVNATGLAMLFSGGTFLYVATVHILPELAHRSPQSASVTLDGALPPRDACASSHKGFNRLEVLVLVIGCLLPLVLAVGHKH